MKEMVVLYSTSAMGHAIPMVELGKLFLRHGFSVTIVLMNITAKKPSFDALAAFLARVSSDHPSLSFHYLPPLPSHPAPVDRMLDFIRLNNLNLLRFLSAAHSPVRALVLDFFCMDALDVAAELRLPAYIFFTSGASVFAAFLSYPAFLAASDLSSKDLCDAPLHFPGLPPIPASHMPGYFADRGSESYRRLIAVPKRMSNADGILINTFESLEPEVVCALRDGAYIPSHQMAPVYCIGPLVADGTEDKGECLAWLDKQPRGSVVFLCFGSVFSFSAEQLKRMATGLERSGQRFLWVVRAPPSEDVVSPPSELDLEALLPEGFLQRTKERGLVVKSWAPQAAVLNHAAVGGFLSHCGWNSTLEAIKAGVALVVWPLYAEQNMNKVLLVEQMRLAVAMDGYDREIVEAEEVEAKVKWLMGSEGGRDLRERAVAVKIMAEEARREGGSSHRAWFEAVEAMKLMVKGPTVPAASLRLDT